MTGVLRVFFFFFFAFLYNIEQRNEEIGWEELERERVCVCVCVCVCVKTWIFNSIIYAVRNVPEEKVSSVGEKREETEK